MLNNQDEPKRVIVINPGNSEKNKGSAGNIIRERYELKISHTQKDISYLEITAYIF